MKHLLNGVAIAAILAIATPALAQNQPGPKASGGGSQMKTMAPAAAAPVAPAAAAPMAKKPMMHHHRHHMAMHRGTEDSMTDQLNRAELARIQGGGAAPGMSGPAPNRLPGPKAN